jgi:hypothetical protein
MLGTCWWQPSPLGVTAAVALVALMLTTGEKKIEQTIARLYDADDLQLVGP